MRPSEDGEDTAVAKKRDVCDVKVHVGIYAWWEWHTSCAYAQNHANQGLSLVVWANTSGLA